MLSPSPVAGRNVGPVVSNCPLNHGGASALNQFNSAFWNFSREALIERALQADEASLSDGGALVAMTGEFTGRSPNDRFIVDGPASAETVWWGSANKAMKRTCADALWARALDYLADKDLYVQDLRAGHDTTHGLNVRIITRQAWHALFAQNMFIRPALADRAEMAPDFTVLQIPEFLADPAVDETRTETAIVVDLDKRRILICGTAYAGEIKKSVFSVLNHLLPEAGVFPMHCSANMGDDGNSALFFGLSGTGKTTLSADPARTLIGDDEHGWSTDGVFNFEGGCYAKTIALSAKGEPEIYAAAHSYGTILENVVIGEHSRLPDFDDTQHTENTRASYRIDAIPNASKTGRAGHPNHVIMLTADAFGVLPPIARLSVDQAKFHFLSGYTAKLAGTERGVTTPQAAFSTCFGAPFMPRHPGEYAELLAKRLAETGAQCWLVNTGWSGGAYGTGERIKLTYTRAMITAILNGDLDQTATARHPVFGLEVPTEIAGVPALVLDARGSWADEAAYDAAAADLAARFVENFSQFGLEYRSINELTT